MNNLPIGDINVVVVTDVHSWIAGHKHEPHLNADYGDVLSFYEQLKQQAEEQNQDVFFVMNGDFVDGTGLSTKPPQFLAPILQRMPWDAVNIGNHELYDKETVDYLIDSGFVRHWNGTYLTSNTLLSATQQPIGNRYAYLYGKATQSKILTFGFLYNFERNCAGTTVERVQDAVVQEWFTDVLNRKDYDAILVLAHMDCVDPLVSTILHAIRAIAGSDMPVQFLTGHSHRRCFTTLDGNAASFEAGRFLDTVGFVSFPLARTVNGTKSGGRMFQYDYIDTNVEVLKGKLGVSKLQTPAGEALSRFIHHTQDELGLHQRLGCSPSTFYPSSPLSSKSSLWEVYLRDVVPTQLFRNNESKILVQETQAFRYPLYAGDVTMDDIIAMCPFNDSVYQLAEAIDGQTLINAFGHSIDVSNRSLPEVGMTVERIDPKHQYSLFVPDYNLAMVRHWVEKASGRRMQPVQVCEGEDCAFTTDVWKSFVQSKWPCFMELEGKADPGVTLTDAGEVSKGLWELLVEAGVLAVVCVVIVMRLIRKTPTPGLSTSPSFSKECGGSTGTHGTDRSSDYEYGSICRQPLQTWDEDQ